MKKSTIIAQCLLNSRMITRLEDGVTAVRRTFQDMRPNEDFAKWDREVDDRTAEEKIRHVGVASKIRVDRFIEDLS